MISKTFIPSPGYSNVSFDSFTLLKINFRTILFETVLRFLTNTVYVIFVYFFYIYSATLFNFFYILKRKNEYMSVTSSSVQVEIT